MRSLDNLTSQVHGSPERPAYLAADVELQVGDIREPAAVKQALEGVDDVVHLAARVGVGQSMYEIAYTNENSGGTAVLLEALLDQPVRRLVVASSMSIYGEGAYRAANRLVEARAREREQLELGEWEPRGVGGEEIEPVPTTEATRPSLTSIYALTKYEQERACLIFGGAYSVPTVALRLFNTYGPRQSLSNPYIGVLAIFASRLLNDRRPLVFEDGLQLRDFVSVREVVQAFSLALDRDEAAGHAINVGSGRSVTVREIGEKLAATVGKELQPELTGKYRIGDIRHCFADISLASGLLSYEPHRRAGGRDGRGRRLARGPGRRRSGREGERRAGFARPDFLTAPAPH